MEKGAGESGPMKTGFPLSRSSCSNANALAALKTLVAFPRHVLVPVLFLAGSVQRPRRRPLLVRGMSVWVGLGKGDGEIDVLAPLYPHPCLYPFYRGAL